MGVVSWCCRADFDKAIGAGETHVHVPADGSIPKELQCELAEGSLILDAVVLPCCQTNVSHKAVLPRLQDSSACPICYQADVTPDMLQENKKLRQSVMAFIRSAKEKGIAIKGMKPAPAPAPPGVTASRPATKGEEPPPQQGVNAEVGTIFYLNKSQQFSI